MAKTVSLKNQDGTHGGWLIECPACGCGHLFDNRWTFNGDVDKPTFRASMLVNANVTKPDPINSPRCRSFVTDGRIQYLNDCTHATAGQTVDLPEF